MIEFLQSVDFGLLFNVVLTIISAFCGVFAFYIKRLYRNLDEHSTEIRQLEKELSDFKLEIAKNHVTRDDLQVLKVELGNMLSSMTRQLFSIEEHLRNKKDH